jgi:hypothetical protein
MTTLTEAGRIYNSDHLAGVEPAPIDTVAIGTGTEAESTDHTSLQNEVYRSNTSNNDVRVVRDDTDPARYNYIIDITGGAQVTGGTTFTEIAAFVSNPQNTTDANGNPVSEIMFGRDVFSGVTVDSGYTESRVFPIPTLRG